MLRTLFLLLLLGVSAFGQFRFSYNSFTKKMDIVGFQSGVEVNTLAAGASQLPAASAGNAGYVRIVTDTQNCVDQAVGVRLCRSTGSVWAPLGDGTGSGSGLVDPGSNGILTRTALNVTAIATAANITGLFSGTGDYLKSDGTRGTPGGTGDVTGPASATDSNFAAFNTASGKLLKDSGAKASDFATAAHNHDAAYAALAAGVTNGNSHDHSGGDGAQVAYSSLSGTPTLGGAASLNVGTTTGTVAAGDDSRLSNARTPTAHAASHGTGQSDVITPAAIGASASNHNHSGTYEAVLGNPDVDGKVLSSTAAGVRSWVAQSGGLSDPGSSGVLKRTALNTTQVAVASDVTGLFSGAGDYLKSDGTKGTPTGAGDVVGPASAVDNNFAAFNTTTGKLVKDSGSKASDFATSGHNHDATYAALAAGVTNGNTHDHSGGDGAQVAYSSLSGTPSLGGAAALNVGTTTGTVAAGDDSRLSNARTPTSHASSHATAGGDPIAAADIGAAASGHNHSGTYEPVLSNPDTDGKVLASTAAGVRSWVAQSGGHTQNTDTGTTGTTFQVDTGANGPKLKHNTGTLEVRNATDTAHLPITASSFNAPAGTAFLALGVEQANTVACDGVPCVFYDSTAHMPQYKNAAGTVAGTMVSPTQSSYLDATSSIQTQLNGKQASDAALTALAAGSDFVQFTGPTGTTKVFTLPDANATLTRTIASGQTAMPTAQVAANACSASATTATATGALTTDAASVSYASDPTGVTGYGAGTNGGITIRHWLTADTINFKLCNETGTAITPGALSVNWRVTR